MVAYGQVLVRLLRPALFRLQGQGHDPARFLTSCGIPPWKAFDPTASVSWDRLGVFWRAAAELAGDPHLGLHAAEFDFALVLHAPMAAEFLGMQLLLHAPDARGALDRYSRYYPTAHSGARLDLRPAPGGEALVLDLPGDWRHTELVVTLLARVIREAASRQADGPEVWFRHEAAGDGAEHRRVLGPRVRFGMPDDRIVIAEAALAAPMPHHRPEALAVLDRRLEQEIAAQAGARAAEATAALPDEVRRLVADRLGHGAPTAEDVARQLGLSVRTLSRRLDALGTSFRALLEEVRAGLARRYVVDDGRSLAEVASLLGYSDARALHRAWQRWFGESPTASRKVHDRK
jgi:AraC-like DNA-binding protein